jgi:hypothetical protein
VIRPILTSGHHATFDNMVDLLDFVIERMLARGEL